MKSTKLLIFVLLGVALVSGLWAQSGTGWPSSAQLTQYGVSGLNQPAGTSGAGWRLQSNLYNYPVMVIWCNGAAAANTAAKNYFQGWTVVYDRSISNTTDICYERANARVYLQYDGREIMITAGIMSEAGGAWPSASVWGRFGLSSLSMPPNTTIESVEDDGEKVTVIFNSGGNAAYANLRSQLITNNVSLTESEGSDTGSEQSQTFYNQRANVAVYLNRNGDSFWIEVFKP